MTIALPRNGVGLLLICSALLYGCAGSPAKIGDRDLMESVGSDNLDLLFATEFPVASKAEAIAKSKVAYRGGDLSKALFYSVKALKFDVTDVELLVRIAHLHVLQGNGVLAARAFNLALAEDPSHAAAHQGLGLLYFKAGNPAKAREHLELAVAGNARLWRSWNVLGVLADGRRDFALAADCYEKALAIRPDSVSVRINRGYSKYLEGDLATAARYTFEVAEPSGHPQAWRNLGLIYGALGWYDNALEIFLKVEDPATAYNSTGALALENDDPSLAEAYLTKAVRHSPVYFAEAERNLAKARSQLGQ